MSPKSAALKTEVLKLPPEELDDLIDELIVHRQASVAFSPAYLAELERRNRQADENPGTLAPWEEVQAELEADLRAIRSRREPGR